MSGPQARPRTGEALNRKAGPFMHDDLEAILERHHTTGNFSGVALVRRGDEEIVHQAWGLAHRGFGIPNTIDTRFDIASITKVFTAASIVQMVDQHLISLDTQVMPFLGIDGTPISDDVTIYHLLTHTSGIADDADEEAGEGYEQLFVDTPSYSIRETGDFLPQCTAKQPVFPPGEGVRYNNCGFVLLGLVIERASGLAYRDYVRQNIFARAGMKRAEFCEMDGVHSDLAEHYKRIDGDDGKVTWRKNIYSYPPIGSPDGGATVTAHDLVRFLDAVRSGTLMSKEISATLLKPHVERRTTDTGSVWNGFAFEFALDASGTVVKVDKDGINAGVASYLSWFPPSEITCVLLANQDCDVWAIHDEMEPLLAS
jgi:CubicO group peptidase (beta-lactamase class C family)